MKIFTNRKFTQKLIIAFVSITLLSFCITPNVQASIGGEMMSIIRPFVLGIGDVVGTLVQYGMTGKWIAATDSKGTADVVDDESSYFSKGKAKYPILQISPEIIFANEVEFLDANFITSSDKEHYLLEVENDNTLEKLRNIIAGWYVTLRTISIVGLLSVLIYIGIRIIISSTSADKAKYKQRLVDWIVAFCLLFFMHYIMAATVTVVDKVNELIGGATHVKDGLPLNPEYGNVKYVGTTEGSITNPGDPSALNAKVQEAKKWLSDNGYSPSGPISNEDELVHTYSFSSTIPDVGVLVTISFNTVTGRTEITSYNHALFTQEKISQLAAAIRSESENGEEDFIFSDDGETGEVLYKGDHIRVAKEAGNDGSRILYFTNYARLYSEGKITDDTEGAVTAYIIIYVALIVFTAVFAFRYIKRVIYIAFLTLIAPTVALTYPLDKIKDRKSTSLEYVV